MQQSSRRSLVAMAPMVSRRIILDERLASARSAAARSRPSARPGRARHDIESAITSRTDRTAARHRIQVQRLRDHRFCMRPEGRNLIGATRTASLSRRAACSRSPPIREHWELWICRLKERRDIVLHAVGEDRIGDHAPALSRACTGGRESRCTCPRPSSVFGRRLRQI